METAIVALQNDVNIEFVSQPIKLDSPFPKMDIGKTINKATTNTANHIADYGWDAMNISNAWQWVSGHALIGVIDVGLATEHPELRSFDTGGSYVRGNFLPAYSLDLGQWPGGIDTNVDELEPEIVQDPHEFCATDPNGMASADFAGHGTHVAGLIASNSYNGTNANGACRKCGIAMWRTAHVRCVPSVGVRPELSTDATIAAITLLGDYGPQAINMSFGFNPL